MATPLFDVILVGGGLTGGVFACALASRGLHVALIDAADPSSHPPEDPRTSAISYGSFNILQDLGLWEPLSAHAQPIHHIRVSQHNSYQVLHYKSADVGGRPLGFMLKNTHLRQALAQKMATLPQIQWFAPDRLEDLTLFSRHAQVTLASGATLQAPLVVAADGARSPLRHKLGIQTLQKSYHQKALIFNIAHTGSHQDTAFEHFLPDGPLALLPFPDKESAIVWSDKTARIEALMALEEKQLLEAFQARFGFGLGRLRLISPLAAFPLQVVLPLKTIHERLAFIGDAAHVVHPVSAQGLNLGLRDGQALAQLIGDYAHLGLDWGSPTLLESYARQRRPDILATVGLTHGLIRLFGVSHPVLTGVRGMGLKMIDNFWPLKKRLLAHAMGTATSPQNPLF